MKPERIQDRDVPVTPDRLQKLNPKLGGWEVDATPNAITRHFPHPSYSASVGFLMKTAKLVEKHGRVPFVTVAETGVTVRLGNPPGAGVNEADLDVAAALAQSA